MNVGDIVTKLTGCYLTEMPYSGATVQLLPNSAHNETPMQALISTNLGPVSVELSAVAYPSEVTQRCNIMVTVGQRDNTLAVSDDDLGNHLRLRVPGIGEVGGRADAGSAGQLLFECDAPADEPLHRMVEVYGVSRAQRFLEPFTATRCLSLPGAEPQPPMSSRSRSGKPTKHCRRGNRGGCSGSPDGHLRLDTHNGRILKNASVWNAASSYISLGTFNDDDA